MNELLSTLIAIYFLCVPFGQLLRLPTTSPEIHIYATDIIIGVIFVFWLGKILLLKKVKEVLTNKISVAILLFVLIALISLLVDANRYSLKENLIGGLYLLRWLAYAGLFPIVLQLTKSSLLRERLKNSMLVSIGLMILFGWAQYFMFPDLKPLYNDGWDDHFYRLTGAIFDPGFTGILLLMGLLFLIDNQNIAYLKMSMSNLLYWAGIVLGYTAIVFTYSRATYLSLFFVAFGYSFIKKTFRIFLLIVALFLLTWFLLPKPSGEGGNLTRTSTINYRFTNWAQAVQIIMDNPVLGVGFNRLRSVRYSYNFLPDSKWQTNHSGAGIDNSWLFVLTTTGFMGLFFYLWIWMVIFREVLSNRSTGMMKGFFVLLALLIHSQFHNTLFYPAVMGWTWTIVALKTHQE